LYWVLVANAASYGATQIEMPAIFGNYIVSKFTGG
jgi:hypothetical protein